MSDWSSDVCSSDLSVPENPARNHLRIDAKRPGRRQAIRRTARVVVHAGHVRNLQGQAYFRPGPHGAQGRHTPARDRPGLCAAVLQPPAKRPDRRQISTGSRSEERRVGKECVSTCRSGWSADNEKKNKKKTKNNV